MERTEEQMEKLEAAYKAREDLSRTDLKMSRMAEESLAFCDGLMALIVSKGIITEDEMSALPSISSNIRELVVERERLREIIRGAEGI